MDITDGQISRIRLADLKDRTSLILKLLSLRGALTMHIRDLELFHEDERTLTVLLDTVELDSMWVLTELQVQHTLVVTFKSMVQSWAKSTSKTLGSTFDVRSQLFTNDGAQFKSVNLNLLMREILSQSPERIFLEHPDILIASGLCSAAALCQFVESLLKSCSVVVSLCISGDILTSRLPVAVESQKCMFDLLHQCQLKLIIRPLETGRSSDACGTFSVRKGAGAAGDNSACREVEESDYFFQVGPSLTDLTLKAVLP